MVFDTAFALAAPSKKMSLATAVDGTPSPAADQPASSYTVNWTMTFSFDATEMVAAPFDIVMGMDSNTNRA